MAQSKFSIWDSEEMSKLLNAQLSLLWKLCCAGPGLGLDNVNCLVRGRQLLSSATSRAAVLKDLSGRGTAVVHLVWTMVPLVPCLGLVLTQGGGHQGHHSAWPQWDAVPSCHGIRWADGPGPVQQQFQTILKHLRSFNVHCGQTATML